MSAAFCQTGQEIIACMYAYEITEQMLVKCHVVIRVKKIQEFFQLL